MSPRHAEPPPDASKNTESCETNWPTLVAEGRRDQSA